MGRRIMADVTKPLDYAALGIKVEALEGDVREVKDSILGLDAKIEKSIAGLAHEVRTSLATLSGQFNDRQRTPWAVLISGAGFLVMVLGVYGHQALSPIQAEINNLKAQSVPRAEIEVRTVRASSRFDNLERDVRGLEYDRITDLRRTIEKLERELSGRRP